MKTFSILLLAATAVHAATTAEATAFGVAFILFCRECGEDVQRIWNWWINEKGRAKNGTPTKEVFNQTKRL